jgi:CheY-like chemotaxis protein
MRSLSLLVADDHPVLRALVARVLAAAGHRVTQAGDGGQALALAQAEAFDLLLLDIEMDGGDGFATAAAIRAGAGPNAATPILFLTGHDPDAVLRDPRAAGLVDGVVGKPLDAGELLRAVDHAARS